MTRQAARDKGARVRSPANPGPPPVLDGETWTGVVADLALSPQQARIVGLILRGMRDKQIAAELGLSVPTVRTYLSRVFVRVGVQDRVELILRVFTVAQERRGHRS